MTGSFLKESVRPVRFGDAYNSYIDINYNNSELLLLVEQIGTLESKWFIHSALYRLNDEFQVKDSCIIRKINMEKSNVFVNKLSQNDFIFHGGKSVYLYKGETFPRDNSYTPSEIVLRDTLYRFKDNLLVPELKLKFRNNGIDRGGNLFIDLHIIYRSSRYIFARYENKLNSTIYDFCYDTKTGKSYNMQDGYTDDIHHIEKRVKIHPLSTNSEYFYYWYTHMNPNDREEPNPTLYICKLKN